MSKRSSRGLDPLLLKPARATGVAEVTIDGETVIYDEVTGAIHQLDRIATVIWQCLDGEATVAELIADLADVYNVSNDRVQVDVLALLDTLSAAGLLAAGRDDYIALNVAIEEAVGAGGLSN